MLILYVVHSGNGYVSVRLSYGQAYTYRPCHTYYVTDLVFLFPYICTTLAYTDNKMIGSDEGTA